MTFHDNPATIRLSSPPDIIGALPSLLGFHPAESLVIVTGHGARRATGLILRADLPDEADTDGYVDDLATRVRSEGADHATLLCYTGDDDTGGELPRAWLVECLITQLGASGIGITEALLVRGGRWWSYTCVAPCCPPEGTRLPDRPTEGASELIAWATFEGRAVLPDRAALERSVQGPVGLRQFVLQQCGDEIEADVLRRCHSTGPDVVRAETVEIARTAYARVTNDGELDDRTVVRILHGLLDHRARDELLTWGLADDCGSVLAFFVALAQRAVDDLATPVCTVLAAVAYQAGDGALAAVALDRALAIQPDYQLAILLRTLLDRQVPPVEIRRAVSGFHWSGCDRVSAGPSGDGGAAAA